jgi:NAD-dependent deacetylase
MDTFGLPGPLVAAFHALLRTPKKIVILSGAGASAESGIPTFRDAQVGLWERFKAEDLATPQAFQRNPGLVWGWYEWRRILVAHAKPNAGHLAITQWQQSRDLTIVTQNVDDLHERAGSGHVIHLHGSLFAARCFDCGRAYELPPVDPSMSAGGKEIDPPHCSHCGGLIRPGVVWFEENLPQEEWGQTEQHCKQTNLLFCIRTSALVYPAASLPQLASKHGATIIQVNPNPTELDSFADYVVRGAAGDIMPRIVRAALAP